MKFSVYIYDSESGCEQPIICNTLSEAAARMRGNEYIKAWNLKDGTITKIERMEEN